MLSNIAAAAACFFASLLAMLALRPVAVAVDLVDKPGGRKLHRGDIPIVGGIAMFIGCIFGLGLVAVDIQSSSGLFAGAALVVIVGLLDDRFELSPYARISAHLVAALLVLLASDLSIQTLGYPFGGNEVRFSELASAGFTCLAVVGAINAFNMLDGMDGLAGTAAFSALIALAYLGNSVGDIATVKISLVGSGAVLAFLVFNIPARFNRRFRCFMGDAGSTLLGFLLACLCISVSQKPGANVNPTTTLWVVAIPLYELLWTTIRRVAIGRSPFMPDRGHFHHQLLDAGFGVRGAFVVLVCLGALFATLGVVIHVVDVPDAVSFALWLVAGLGLILLMRRARLLALLLPKALSRERRVEFESSTGT